MPDNVIVKISVLVAQITGFSVLSLASRLLLAGMFLFAGCQANHQSNQTSLQSMPLRDINEVLKDHDRALLAYPGVVGVYVGLMKDQKTSCLRVMVVKITRELKRQIPQALEGYPVVLEETGVIRPF